MKDFYFSFFLLCYLLGIQEERDYHWVTLLVNSTGGFADIDSGSALAIISVYMSENLGNLEVTTKPVVWKDPYRKFIAISVC